MRIESKQKLYLHTKVKKKKNKGRMGKRRINV